MTETSVPPRRKVLRQAAALSLALSLAAGWPGPAAARNMGSGTAIGCTQSALATALAAGGSITFNCGPGPHSILLDTPLTVTTMASIDGAGQITVSGQNSTTLTHMIAPGSPAEDHGGFCAATDQRGFPRTGPGTGLACDIGAVERQAGEPFGWVYLSLIRR